METGQVCIQSFAPHGVKFLTKGNGVSGLGPVILEIPAGFVPNNFVVADRSVVDSLADDPTFKTLVESNSIRILDKIPERYADPSLAVQTLRSKLIDATAATAKEAEAKAKLEAENALLKEELEALRNGGKKDPPAPPVKPVL